MSDHIHQWHIFEDRQRCKWPGVNLDKWNEAINDPNAINTIFDPTLWQIKTVDVLRMACPCGVIRYQKVVRTEFVE